MSRLPQPGERARILSSEIMDRIGATGRTGAVLDVPGMLIVVRLDDTTGMPPYSTRVLESGTVFCTISEVELEDGVDRRTETPGRPAIGHGGEDGWIGGTDADDDERSRV